MKRLLLVICVVMAPTTAKAEILGYAEASAGAAFVQDVNTRPFTYSDPLLTFSGRGELDYKVNLTGGAEIGAAGFFAGKLRVGVSYDYTRAKLDRARLVGTVNGVSGSLVFPRSTLEAAGLDLDTNVHVLDFDAYYNLPPIGDKFRAYVGGGVGAAFIQHADAELAFNATAGIRQEVTESYYVGMRYRFHHIAVPTDDLGIEYKGINAHTVSVVIGIYLN